MTLDDASSFHQRAMDLADEGFMIRRKGDSARGTNLLRKAMELEREAADIVAPQLDLEPTRSVLHRSAASLALECGESRIAEQLIGRALAGNPPDEIADELRDLIEKALFSRHLDLQGISLDPSEVQLSISGRAVGHGIAESDEFVNRIRTVKDLFQRTAERRLNRAYRERGAAGRGITENLELYISVPRAASFAVTLRVGSPSQLHIPGIPRPLGQTVIQEVVECVDFLNSRETQQLRQRIPDEAYYRNFVALVGKLSPDGENVKTVGMTALIDGNERRVFIKPARGRMGDVGLRSDRSARQRQELEQIRGLLKYADSTKEREGIIQVIDKSSTKHRIKVPLGMMSDIVRPLYEREVVISVTRRGQVLTLESIDPSERARPAGRRRGRNS